MGNITGGTAGQVPYQSAPNTTLFTGPGTAGQVLQSNGTSAPAYAPVTLSNTSSVTGVLPVANGGTGANTLALGSVVIGGGPTGAVTTVAPGPNGNLLLAQNGVWVSAPGPSTAVQRADFTVTQATQSTFNTPYTAGLLFVYVNGALLTGSEFTATDGVSFTLATAATTGDVIETLAYTSAAIGLATSIAGGSANQLLYQTTTSATGFISPGTSGNALVSGGPNAAPSFGTLSASGGGTGITSPGASGNVLTSNGTNWVSQPLVNTPSWLAVGSYAIFRNVGGGVSQGSTTAGSNLRYNISGGFGGSPFNGYSNDGGTYNGGGSAPPGTWQAMADANGRTGPNCSSYYWVTSLWLRVS